MTTGRILPFTPRAMPRESLSPFRHLMPQRPLSPREVLHRRRMLGAFGGSYRLKSFPGSASSNRPTNESGPVMK